MKTDKLRRLFLDYFKALDHTIFPSDSLAPRDDPTVLFTGAGMNQFKSYFLGEKKDLKRAASCQKCIRTADLARVGETDYHHTFFEMLGNFSFGDYFKEEAIQYAWDFVTKELLLKKNDLWVSIFEKDEEAFNIWKKKIGMDEKRILRFSAADNFWPANAAELGPNGPCGPCSEIYFGRVPPRGVEIWNLVFTQYDRQEDGVLQPLPQKNIDTGMGLERLAAVLQQVKSNFEIDIFAELERALASQLGGAVRERKNRKPKNALLDHTRAIAFAIADGIIPSNEGRGYVVRKLIRKSVLHLKELKVEEPKLFELVPTVISAMGSAYPELKTRSHGISAILKKEEESFWNVLETRIPQAEIKIKTIALTAGPGKEMSASRKASELAFEFYDTYGVPKEILQEIITTNGLSWDEAFFSRLVDEQRERSRFASGISESVFAKGEGDLFEKMPQHSVFLGYETLKAKGKIVGMLADRRETARLEKGQKGSLVLDRTPFYAEQGGQVGDIGEIQGAAGKAIVSDTQGYEGLILHQAEVVQGYFKIGDAVASAVDAENREKIMKNHTATHLLHSALQKVLGPHAKQNGSLVAPDRLRFDFTHFEALTREQIASVERLVNEQIRQRRDVQTQHMKTKDAMAGGAMAFFGEKYGERVRVLSVGDFSQELCGGTHVRNTGDIGYFRIVSEGSVQAGVRRIEAVTATTAYQKRDEDKTEMLKLMAYLSSDERNTAGKLATSLKQLSEVQKNLDLLLLNKLKNEMKTLLEKAPTCNGVKVMTASLPRLGLEQLRRTTDWIRSTKTSYAVVLSTESDRKPQVLVALSKDVVKKGMDASLLVKEITKRIDGSGGGRSELAVGGGKSLKKLGEAMRFAEDYIERSLKAS